MDAARFDKTRKIIELTEELPDNACQMAYVFLQGMVAAQRLNKAKIKKEDKDNDSKTVD